MGLGPGERDVTGTRVVVVGVFENPEFSSGDWPKVGRGMSDALARSLLNRGGFDVIVNPRLASDVARLRDLPDASREKALQSIRQAHPDVRLVVNGRVTDFAHTSDLPEVLVRRRFYGAKQREAVVALQMDVFDLERGRTVATDHVHGTAPAPDMPTGDIYARVPFDSLVFWQTPLGRASEAAVFKAIAVLDKMVPTGDDSIVVVEQVDARTVRIAAGGGRPLTEGTVLWLYERRPGPDGSVMQVPVFDPHSRFQLRAHVQRGGRVTTTAFLFGKLPDGLDVRGLVLREDEAVWDDFAADEPGLGDDPSGTGATATTGRGTTPAGGAVNARPAGTIGQPTPAAGRGSTRRP